VLQLASSASIQPPKTNGTSPLQPCFVLPPESCKAQEDSESRIVKSPSSFSIPDNPITSFSHQMPYNPQHSKLNYFSTKTSPSNQLPPDPDSVPLKTSPRFIKRAHRSRFQFLTLPTPLKNADTQPVPNHNSTTDHVLTSLHYPHRITSTCPLSPSSHRYLKPNHLVT
jgi:hypothetical protein